MWWAALLNTVLGSLSSGVAAATGSYESIATLTPTGGSAVSFNSIPNTYKHLQIRFTYKDSSTTDYAPTATYFYYTFNSDGGANYTAHRLIGNGSAASANAVIPAYGMYVYGSYMSSNATYANMVGVGIVDIHDYASTTKYKTARHFAGGDANGSGTTNRAVALSSGLWLNTSAITTITCYFGDAGFASGTQIALYGIKG